MSCCLTCFLVYVRVFGFDRFGKWSAGEGRMPDFRNQVYSTYSLWRCAVSSFKRVEQTLKGSVDLSFLRNFKIVRQDNRGIRGENFRGSIVY